MLILVVLLILRLGFVPTKTIKLQSRNTLATVVIIELTTA